MMIVMMIIRYMARGAELHMMTRRRRGRIPAWMIHPSTTQKEETYRGDVG
jgi:hypothetical protein